MSTPPRRRRSNPSSPKAAGGGWLPTLAMGLGVVVAGLGIGALIAVYMQRGAAKPQPASAPVAVVTSTAEPEQTFTRPPVVIATIEPRRTARPSPTPTAAPSPTTEASPSPSPTADQTSAPTLPPSAVPAPPVVATTSGATRVAQAEHASASPPAVAPETANTPVPTPPPSTPPASASSATVSAYDEHASAVVRRYIDALIRGDEKTAYDTLGGSGGTLAEQSFLDPSARIVSIKVTRIDASNASVGCEIVSAKGRFYATYHVTAATSGPYISEHDYIKV